MNRGTDHLRICTLFLLFGLGLTACGLKPDPIYRSYSEKRGFERKKTDRRGKGFTRPHNRNGDRGVSASDATYEKGAFKSQSYSLKSTSFEWKLANELLPYLNTPYKYGGESVKGIDCSGLTRVVYLQAFGKDLPHKAAWQFKMGTPVPRNRLKAGDLVFFYASDSNSKRIGHVGIYLSDNQFIHSMSGAGVVISDLRGAYWVKYYAGARRYVE